MAEPTIKPERSATIIQADETLDSQGTTPPTVKKAVAKPSLSKTIHALADKFVKAGARKGGLDESEAPTPLLAAPPESPISSRLDSLRDVLKGMEFGSSEDAKKLVAIILGWLNNPSNQAQARLKTLSSSLHDAMKPLH